MDQEGARKRRILLVSPLPPPQGGIATWTQTILARGLPGRFDLEVVNTRVTRKHFSDNARPTPKELWRTFSIIRKVWSAVRSGRCSVVHINHAPHTGIGILRDYVVARIATHYRVPFAIQLRGTYDSARIPSGFIGALQRRAYRGVFRRASAILPLDAASENRLNTDSPENVGKTNALPNFIECATVPAKSEPQRPEGPLRVIFAGALIRDKGVYTMLELARRLEGVSLTLIGRSSPEMAAEMAQAIEHDGLHDRLHLAGEMPNERVRETVTGQDVCILPSFTEGFPMSVLEAMAIGLPVVASPVGALPDMIDVPEGGFLVGFGDIDGYVEALTRLRDDRATAATMGIYNRERALSDYDYDVVAQRLADLYSGLADAADGQRGADS
jgi:glycosyltransferase involved in cell wall biosynthesis